MPRKASNSPVPANKKPGAALEIVVQKLSVEDRTKLFGRSTDIDRQYVSGIVVAVVGVGDLQVGCLKPDTTPPQFIFVTVHHSHTRLPIRGTSNSANPGTSTEASAAVTETASAVAEEADENDDEQIGTGIPLNELPSTAGTFLAQIESSVFGLLLEFILPFAPLACSTRATNGLLKIVRNSGLGM